MHSDGSHASVWNGRSANMPPVLMTKVDMYGTAPDTWIRFCFAAAFVLNGLLVTQILMYGNRSAQVKASQKQKQKKVQ